ncbi:hypothetical protein NQ315_001745 [Exocentrus adspersus]|uniref:F-box domain-containing protein n=1 Tax=Exocentrus adspersus TaxID=1586481 RepID=A0AAV8W9C1_9CUCU|nr:hypothetical protein NQ315_001745 [Exocentrus adspersus]
MDNSEEINDESDHDDQCVLGYYTRSKRRKLNNKKQQEETTTSSHEDLSERKRKNPIMFLPSEILQAVFKYMSHHELSVSVRLVNRRFKINAENVLNLAFKKLEKKLDGLIKTAEVSLAYMQDDMEIKCVLKMLNMVEVTKTQHAIVISTIWRYVYNDYYRTNRACMYGGLLIDAYHTFIWKFLHCPSQLYASNEVKNVYVLPREVTRIVQMTKTFSVYFDKLNEEPFQNSLVYTGCKILDILDCGKFVQKLVLTEKATADAFVANYTYFFHNSWFIGLPIAVTKDMDWNQKQRMMHMRLRRIVLAHNDMFLQQTQYERELMLRPNPATRVKKPGNNVYTGYGDVVDTFFYYGVMNDGAYVQKFRLDDDNDEDDDVDEAVQNQEVNEAHPNVARNNSEEDIFYHIAHLGFRMYVDVKCPLSYAPLQFLEKLDVDQQESLKRRHRTKGPSSIDIVFECEGGVVPAPTHGVPVPFQAKARVILFCRVVNVDCPYKKCLYLYFG